MTDVCEHTLSAEAIEPTLPAVGERNGFIDRIWRGLSWFGPYAPLVLLVIAGLLLLSLSRVGLMLWQLDRVAAAGIWPAMLIQGVRVDLIQLGMFCAPPLAIMPLVATGRFWPWWRKGTFAWVILSIFILFFMEAATPGFIAEYDLRPNRLFVEYLKYPREVVSMLWFGFRVTAVLGVVCTGLALWGVVLLMRPWLRETRRWPALRLWLTWPLACLMVFIAVRSTTAHRPANPAMFALTADPMVNSLILNSS